MIPLSDPGIHRLRTPYVTGALVAASVLVFLYQLSLNQVESFLFTYRFGAIPAEVLGRDQLGQAPVLTVVGVRLLDVISPVPDWVTMFTSMFMHAGLPASGRQHALPVDLRKDYRGPLRDTFPI